MPKTLLTDLMIKNLKPPARGQQTTWDTQLTGFGVRVSQGGSKTFVVMHGQRRKRVTIGRYPLVPLAEARKKARQILLVATLDPSKVPSAPFDVAVERFLTMREPEVRPATFREYKRLLTTRFAWGDTLVEDIATHEAANYLDAIESQSERTHAYTVLKIFFNWCVERQYCLHNPLNPIRKPKVPDARERVLSDMELAGVWEATQDMGKYGAIVRLLMVSGQRANQIARLQEDWIDYKKKTITFPSSVMKNGREHELPFGTLMEFLLRSVIPMQGYLFSPVGKAGRPFSAWSKNKLKLDRLLNLPDPFTLHDLRRTWATNAPRLDISPHIAERMLSHASPGQSKVHAIYDRYRYRDEMRAAAEKMESHILGLVSTSSSE